VLDGQATELARSLHARGLRGRTVSIKVRLDDFTTVTRARTLVEATDDPATIAGAARALIRAYDPPRPVRLLGVRAASFEDAGMPGPQAQALPLPH
jgi:DNA polymerase IV